MSRWPAALEWRGVRLSASTTLKEAIHAPQLVELIPQALRNGPPQVLAVFFQKKP